MSDELVAIFAHPDMAQRALERMRERSAAGVRCVSPAPYPLVNQTGHPGPWRYLGWLVLLGAITGLSCATALEVITSRSMGLVVGGKPIVAWTAFGVVMFEMTMLFSGAANFLALIVLSALARRRVAKRAREQVNSERIAVIVPVGSEGAARRAELAASLAIDAAEVLP